MRREILSIVNGTVVTLLVATCAPGSSADRADTSAAPAESVATTRRDTVGATAPEIAVGTAPAFPTADTASESIVVHPITCTPNTFRLADTLMLGMVTPHGDELSIHAPNRTVYSLVYPLWGKPKRNYSVIPSEEFRRIATLPIPGDVRAIPLVKGRDTILEPVFNEPGKYTIVMGENLGSDYSNRSSYCIVTFLRPLKQ
jgi:hypothetical protein